MQALISRVNKNDSIAVRAWKRQLHEDYRSLPSRHPHYQHVHYSQIFMTSPSKGLPKTLLLEVLISAAMRSGKVLHLFFLFHSSTVFFSEGNSESDPRSSYFKTLRNKQLLGYAVKRFSSPSLLSCGQRCLMASWCTSTNFRLFSEKDGRGTCELNSHNISDSNENINVEDREQVTFSLRLKVIYL